MAHFNTTFVTELKYKIRKLNHTLEIYAKCHLNNKLLNSNSILDRYLLHGLGIIFHFKKKSVTCSISMKPPNRTAKKSF